MFNHCCSLLNDFPWEIECRILYVIRLNVPKTRLKEYFVHKVAGNESSKNESGIDHKLLSCLWH